MDSNTNPAFISEINRSKKKIRRGALAGCVFTLVVVIQSFWPFLGLSPATMLGLFVHGQRELTGQASNLALGIPLFLALNLTNLSFVMGLTIGVFRKNELCAILLFSYGVISLVLTLPFAFAFFGLPVVVLAVLLIFLFQGMVGTYEYRQILKNQGQRAN